MSSLLNVRQITAIPRQRLIGSNIPQSRDSSSHLAAQDPQRQLVSSLMELDIYQNQRSRTLPRDPHGVILVNPPLG